VPYGRLGAAGRLPPDDRTAIIADDPRRRIVADENLLGRITVDPEIFGGKPIVRGMRISVELILSLLRQGASWDDLRQDYPELEVADIQACLEYARTMIANESLSAVEVISH
jgi:uncharacterized protein (DUF433 family)